MKKIFLLIFLCLSSNASAMVSGMGQFTPQEGDSASFVKNQLKYQAFKDIITRELSSMNLDSRSFWQNHYHRFEDSFQSVEQKLKENFEQNKLSAKEYQDALRSQKLSAMARFGNLNRLIRSYSEKGHTRSPDTPNVRQLNIDATLDRRALAKLYFKTIRNRQKSQPYQRVYLSTEFHLQGDNWNQVGVKKKSDFTETLSFHWKKWFKKHYKSIKEIILVDAAEWEYLKNHLRTPHQEIRTGYYENSNTAPPRRFQNSLWILVKVQLKKVSEAPSSKKRTFHIKGDVMMTDLKTRKIVAHQDLPPLKKDYSFSTPHKLSSDLATQIWKLPLETFRSHPTHTPSDIKRIGLAIREIGSIRELLQVKELLINRGPGQGFAPRIATYSGNHGIIELSYQGADDKALKALNSIDGTELVGGKKLVAQDPFSFAIKPL